LTGTDGDGRQVDDVRRMGLSETESGIGVWCRLKVGDGLYAVVGGGELASEAMG
jgi:hypothetical protein